MTIETTRAPAEAKASAAGSSAAAPRPSQAAKSGGGFASVMSLLAATDAPSQAADAALASVTPASDTLSKDDQNQPLAHDGKGLADIGSIAAMLGQLAAADSSNQAADAALPPAATTSETLLKDDKNQPLALDGKGLSAIDLMSGMLGLPNAALVPATSVPVLPVLPDAVPELPISAATAKGAKPAASGAADSTQGLVATSLSAATQPPQARAAEVSASQLLPEDQAQDVKQLLDHRRASQASLVSAEPRDAKGAQLLQVSASTAELGRVTVAAMATSVLPTLQERQGGKPQSGAAGAGAEGLFGSVLADRLGINPTYEVAAASAVVPEGQVAETVSYWASQGVQSAELTLDGLGDEPVEVRISVEGDQAQIDFRSNQPEVRQVLEAASAQLKAMLSGEGLQLTGMSVGTSGRGANQGEGGQPKPSARQTKLVSLEPARAASARAANPAVGQALDLYV